MLCSSSHFFTVAGYGQGRATDVEPRTHRLTATFVRSFSLNGTIHASQSGPADEQALQKCRIARQ
jgi:hypothetical protein